MNPEKMGSIFQNINKVMEQKMESGDLSEESLKKEAQDMYGNMANNPLFGNLMGKMNEAQADQTQTDQNSTAEKELTKAACCDLAGCFETQISVESKTTNIITKI